MSREDILDNFSDEEILEFLRKKKAEEAIKAVEEAVNDLEGDIAKSIRGFDNNLCAMCGRFSNLDLVATFTKAVKNGVITVSKAGAKYNEKYEVI